jgi:hypothetical protein
MKEQVRGATRTPDANGKSAGICEKRRGSIYWEWYANPAARRISSVTQHE